MERGANLTEQRDGVYVRWEKVDQAQILKWEDEAHARGAQRYNWYVVPEGTLDKISGGAQGRERWDSRPEDTEIKWVHVGTLPEAGLVVKKGPASAESRRAVVFGRGGGLAGASMGGDRHS